MGHHRLKAAAGASPADPYFSSTSLLLLGNGTNGGQNNTFVDGSTNNFTVTRNGNTTQGSFSPFSAPDGRWSNYFDGSGDYLTGPSNSAFSFGTSDFTAECWVYFTSLPTANQSLFDFRNGSDNSSFFMGVYSNNIPFFANQSGGVLNGSFTFNVNTWYHIAYTRSGTSLNIWVNGTNVGTTTNSTNLTGTNCKIGADSSGAYNVFGYISNARVIKGTALYTANFTPSTSPLTAIANTSLLTCQSNRFKDNSTNAFTITPSGNAAVTPFSPFAPLAEYSAGSNGGSGYFDGSGDYLALPSNSAFAFSGDFTVEGWIYLTSTAATTKGIFGTGPNSNEFSLYLTSGNQLNFVIEFVVVAGGGTVSINTWTHVACSRSSGTVRLFINGNIVNTTSNATSISASAPLVSSSGSPFPGYISSLRILKGTAQYTANFTPPTSPLTAITNTSLLLNFTNASILDSTAKNDLETVGDAQVSTSVKKFGTGSMAFDGTGDYLVSYSSPTALLMNFGTGDFTIEMWLYFSSTSGNQGIVDNASSISSALSGKWFLYKDSSGNLIFGEHNVGAILSYSWSPSTSTWYFIAVSRSGGTIKMFINGTSVASASNSTNFSSAGGVQVGIMASINPLNGYIDDLRITKGVARYTSNFTPPSAQLPSR
jgi:hypothetical protein